MRTYYRPPKKAGKYAALCFILLAAATAAAILGFEIQKSVLYVLSSALVFLSVQVFTVYILPSYEYGLDGGVLSVYRVIGKHRRCVYDLDLDFASSVMVCKDAKAFMKEKGKPKRRFYCLCGSSKRKSAVLFYETDTSFALYFAPDDAFFKAVKDQIRQARSEPFESSLT